MERTEDINYLRDVFQIQNLHEGSNVMLRKPWRIGLVGFGNVGQGFVKVLVSKETYLRRRYGFEFRVVGIADPRKGSAFDPDGLNLPEIVNLVEKEGSIKSYEGGGEGLTGVELCRSDDVDVIVEVTPTNLESGEPGLTHIREALSRGKHVVTSNKAPIAIAFRELNQLAEEVGVMLRFEGTVLSGTPALNLALECMAGVELLAVEGIVNGTTNYVLTRMEEGLTFREALSEARMLGYAEANPTADVEGWDAAVKAVIIANLLMDGDITLEDVEREGITRLTREEVQDAVRRGKRVKLLTKIIRGEGRLKASVRPTELDLTHPLANVKGVTNALAFHTDHLGLVAVTGPGAGRVETGQALLSDLLAIHRYYGGLGTRKNVLCNSRL